jgi:hypothetical protein
MIHNEATYALFAPDLDEKDRTRERLGERFQTLNARACELTGGWPDVAR